jgi:hypothetical protein
MLPRGVLNNLPPIPTLTDLYPPSLVLQL